MTEQEKKTKPGPEEERLVIEGDWKDAMHTAINKDKPKEGWPMANENFTVHQRHCDKCETNTPHKVTIFKDENGNRIERAECQPCGETTEKPKP